MEDSSAFLDLKKWRMAEKRGQEASWDAGVYFWHGFKGACNHFNWPVGTGSPSTGPQVRRTPEREEFTKRSGWTNRATDSCHRLTGVLGSCIPYLHIPKGNNSVVWVVTFGDISLRLLWRNSNTENLLVPSQCWELPWVFPSMDKCSFLRLSSFTLQHTAWVLDCADTMAKTSLHIGAMGPSRTMPLTPP